jgi:hypothetical protein
MAGSLLIPIMTIWGIVTAVFLALVIWKSIIGFREEDIVILDEAEAKQAAEQKVVVAKIEKLAGWVKRFGFASLAFLVLAGGIWVYRAMSVFNGQAR